MGRQKPNEGEEELLVAMATSESHLRSVAAKAGPDSADLLQDAMLRAIESHSRTPIRQPAHFLARITRNAVIDRLRKNARHGQVFIKDAQCDAVDLSVNAERALIASERLQRVLAIVNAMPPKRREVFIAHRIDDLSYAEIARRLCVSIKTVEKHVALAIEQLYREIGDD